MLQSTEAAFRNGCLPGQPLVHSGEVDSLLGSSSDDARQATLMTDGDTIVPLENKEIHSFDARIYDLPEFHAVSRKEAGK